MHLKGGGDLAHVVDGLQVPDALHTHQSAQLRRQSRGPLCHLHVGAVRKRRWRALGNDAHIRDDGLESTALH